MIITYQLIVSEISLLINVHQQENFPFLSFTSLEIKKLNSKYLEKMVVTRYITYIVNLDPSNENKYVKLHLITLIVRNGQLKK